MPEKFPVDLSANATPIEGFHDCHIRGIRWNAEAFGFILSIGYILEWRLADNGHYRFLVAPADFVFENADGISVTLLWERTRLDADIDSVSIIGSRKAPNGMMENHYEIALHNPDGVIRLWATGYKVVLTGPAVDAKTPGAF